MKENYEDYCDGCANAGEENIATHTVETWDEGDGFVTYHYCDDCFNGLDDECDRCGEQITDGNYGICNQCINDYNNGERY